MLIGSDVQIIDHGHGMRRDTSIRLQKAESALSKLVHGQKVRFVPLLSRRTLAHPR